MEYHNLSIFLISARDPISNLISFISGETYTSVGMCYPTDVNGYKSSNILVYNTWQSSKPTWLAYLESQKSNITKMDIFNHELIDSFVEYPININNINRFTNILTKILIESDLSSLDNTSYDWLIKNQLGISDDECNETGFDIINYVIKMLINPKCDKPRGTMKLIENGILDKPVYQKNIFSDSNSNQINDYLFNHQIDVVFSSMKRIFLTEWLTNKNIRTSRGLEGMKEYIEAEDMLIKTKRNDSCEKYLDRLNSIRNINSLSTLTNDSFDIKNVNTIISSLSELSEWIHNIVNKSKAEEVPVIRLDKIIDYHNKISSMFNLNKITNVEIPHVNSVLSLSDDSVVTVKNDVITLINPRLERFGTEDLKKILKHLNEISILDNKYISLQKIIALELSNRI